MTCTEFLSKLTDYFDDHLEADLIADVKAHVKKCSHCEVVMDTTRKTISIYRENELYEFPDALRDRLHAAIMKKCSKSN
ncbi:MAG: zf-HC2 domain-containing protein [Acidobacteriaceae bacterium]|nr:zf-HC2 domain-containing protein [Acidobacteriaceae bacterium]